MTTNKNAKAHDPNTLNPRSDKEFEGIFACNNQSVIVKQIHIKMQYICQLIRLTSHLCSSLTLSISTVCT